ncbi:MAG: hypothetical protein IAE99_13655 [Rhodothermales bacterium]|nr:hypothetical protein [Rhodothermales bacterium]
MNLPWHPVLIHFPIALLMVGGGAALIWLATGRTFWRQAALALVFLGAIGAFAAKQTGEGLEKMVEERGGVNEALLHEHEESGEQTVIVAFLALAALGFAEYRARKGGPSGAKATDSIAIRAVAALLTVAAAGMVARTGHLGGTLTWGGLTEPAVGSDAGTTAPPAGDAPVSRDVDNDGD